MAAQQPHRRNAWVSDTQSPTGGSSGPRSNAIMVPQAGGLIKKITFLTVCWLESPE